jgi:hypothetical protein
VKAAPTESAAEAGHGGIAAESLCGEATAEAGTELAGGAQRFVPGAILGDGKGRSFFPDTF